MIDSFVHNIINSEITELEDLKRAIERDDKEQSLKIVNGLIIKMNMIKKVISKIKLNDSTIVNALKKLLL